MEIKEKLIRRTISRNKKLLVTQNIQIVKTVGMKIKNKIINRS